MKKRIILLSCFLVFTGFASAQESIELRLNPDWSAPTIGQIESLQSASPAPWPEGSPTPAGWQPVYLPGSFEVYLRNNDIAKDLSAKPGSIYYLRPELDSPRLAVAKESDRSDIVSIVNSTFAKIRLDTTVVAYAPTGAQAPAPSSPAGSTSAPAETPPPRLAAPDRAEPPPEAVPATVKELHGRLASNGMFLRNRTGTQYRIVALDGQTLAFVDFEQLSSRLRPQDFANQTVRVRGLLEQNESGDLIIVAQNIASSN